MFALGIPNTGKATTKMLADHYFSLEAAMNANAEKLAGLPDIGGIVVESIVSFLADPVVVTSINSVLALGVQAKAPEYTPGEYQLLLQRQNGS